MQRTAMKMGVGHTAAYQLSINLVLFFLLFGENLFDERAQISGNFVNDRARITTNRPATVGMRVSFDY